MKTGIGKAALLAAATILWTAPWAVAQKGIGEDAGIARDPGKAEIASFKAAVIKVVSHPCEKTTGRAPSGTHVFARNKAGDELNIHLGPEDKVREIAEQLAPGAQVKFRAFRTREMAENHYVAVTLSFSGKVLRLRDDQLRPFWAGDDAGRGQGRRDVPGSGGKGRRGR